jgi:hypothetical protein
LNAPRNVFVNPFETAFAAEKCGNRVIGCVFRFRAAADRRPEMFDDKARKFLRDFRFLQLDAGDAAVKVRVRRFFSDAPTARLNNFVTGKLSKLVKCASSTV